MIIAQSNLKYKKKVMDTILMNFGQKMNIEIFDFLDNFFYFIFEFLY